MDETVLWQLSYGMYAIGAKHGEEDKGCIVNTVVQITAAVRSSHGFGVEKGAAPTEQVTQLHSMKNSMRRPPRLPDFRDRFRRNACRLHPECGIVCVVQRSL